MQFLENELLQFIGGLALLGVNAGLSEKHLGVEAGLFKQQTQAVVLGGERICGAFAF